MDTNNSVKANLVLSKGTSSEKTVSVSNNNGLKVRVCPKQQDFSSSSSNGAPGDHQTRFLVQNHGNFKKSDEPGRVMYFDSDGSWVDYPQEVLYLVKCCFKEGKGMAEVSMQGSHCLVDFYRMLEVEFETGHEKSIAWIDVKGKCFFPQTFVNSTKKLASCDGIDGCETVVGDKGKKIAIEVKVVGDTGAQESLNKRKRETGDVEVDQVVRGKPEAGSLALKHLMPKKRQFDASGSGTVVGRWPNAKLLSEEDQEYKAMKSLFLSVLGRGASYITVTRIHKCTRDGPLQKARFRAFHTRIENVKAARGDANNTTFAWHGTSVKGVGCILAHGFGMPDGVDRRPHGYGVCLSPITIPGHSAISAKVDADGEKHVLLVRVILGKCEKLSPAQSSPSSPDFDTGMDDLINPKYYVVWPANVNTHILPEMVISFKPISGLQGQLKNIPPLRSAVSALSIGIPELVSKIEETLPLRKVKEVRDLLLSWMEGKIGKDVFMEELRLAAGDETVRAAIRQLRG